MYLVDDLPVVNCYRNGMFILTGSSSSAAERVHVNILTWRWKWTFLKSVMCFDVGDTSVTLNLGSILSILLMKLRLNIPSDPASFLCWTRPPPQADSPSMSAVTPSCPAGVAAPALVQFQLGLFREVVRVPAGNLSYRHARRLAVEVIERKVKGGIHKGPFHWFNTQRLDHFAVFKLWNGCVMSVRIKSSKKSWLQTGGALWELEDPDFFKMLIHNRDKKVSIFLHLLHRFESRLLQDSNLCGRSTLNVM